MIGKHFIITGATSGLGYAITNELLQRGAHVTILAKISISSIESKKTILNLNISM